MRVLFVHQHFPGPFGAIAEALAALPNNKVLFLAERGSKEARLSRVRRLSMSGSQHPSSILEEHKTSAESEMTASLQRAANTANALLRLRKEGFTPDMVYAASSGGNNMYIQDIFPNALYVAYANWFYTKDANYYFFHKNKHRSPVDFAPARVHNLFQYNAVAECDVAITSTFWQKNQYPDYLANKIHVLAEGVDNLFFTPKPEAVFTHPECDLSHAQELVTFMAGSPPFVLGIPQFFQSLPRLLASRPHCHVVVMTTTPAMARETVLSLLNALDTTPASHKARVHVPCLTTPEACRDMLRASTAHVYLTAPFNVSSGLFKAMSCGCVVVGSRTAPLEEVITHNVHGLLTDFWDSEALTDTLLYALDHKERLAPMRHAARQRIESEYALTTQTTRHVQTLMEHFALKTR